MNVPILLAYMMDLEMQPCTTNGILSNSSYQYNAAYRRRIKIIEVELSYDCSRKRKDRALRRLKTALYLREAEILS